MGYMIHLVEPENSKTSVERSRSEPGENFGKSLHSTNVIQSSIASPVWRSLSSDEQKRFISCCTVPQHIYPYPTQTQSPVDHTSRPMQIPYTQPPPINPDMHASRIQFVHPYPTNQPSTLPGTPTIQTSVRSPFHAYTLMP